MHQIQPVLDALDTLPEGTLASESDEEEDGARVNLLADAGYCSAELLGDSETAGETTLKLPGYPFPSP